MPRTQWTSVYDIYIDDIVGEYNIETMHVFIAIISEPATLMLLALGMLMAWRRR